MFYLSLYHDKRRNYKDSKIIFQNTEKMKDMKELLKMEERVTIISPFIRCLVLENEGRKVIKPYQVYKTWIIG